MNARTVIIVIALFILGLLLFASQMGLINAFIMMAGFVVLGFLRRETEDAKRAKDQKDTTAE